jgi:O-antigen/teichoic acid export membrane protein
MLYIERFFVSYYCGLSDAGIYTFYASLSLTLHNLVNAGVSKMRLSHLLSAYQQNNRQQFNHESVLMLKNTTIFVVLFVIVSLVLIYPFVILLNKPVYLTQLPVFYCLLFGSACRSISDAPLYRLYAQRRDRLLLSINLAAFCLMLLGNVLLVPQWGVMGAAISSAVASLLLLSYSLCTMGLQIWRPDQPLEC